MLGLLHPLSLVEDSLRYLCRGKLESHPSPLFLAFAFRSLHGRVWVWLLVISSDCHAQSLTTKAQHPHCETLGGGSVLQPYFTDKKIKAELE